VGKVKVKRGMWERSGDLTFHALLFSGLSVSDKVNIVLSDTGDGTLRAKDRL